MTIVSKEAEIAQYDQNLAQNIEAIKKLGPFSSLLYKGFWEDYEKTFDDPGMIYEHLRADFALLGLVTCLLAIDREKNDD